MKYLYQQLLAFWSLIVIILIIIGISFMKFTKMSLEENNYSQLYSYAKGMQDNYLHFYEEGRNIDSPNDALITSLNLTESILSYQDVQFYYVDKNQALVYPTLSGKKLKISSEDWQKLQDPNFSGFIKDTTTVNLLGDRVPTSYIIIPFYTRYNQFAGALLASQPAENIAKTMAPLKENLIKGFILSTIVALLLSIILANYQTRRINRLKKATKEISEGHFDIQVPLTNRHHDEIDELGEDFNQMALYLKNYKQEVEEQEERRIQFMADASHEMRTPLTTINGLLEGLQYHAIPENKQENALKLMSNETKRLIRLVNENLDYEKIRTNQITMVIKALNGKKVLENIVEQLKQKAQQAQNQLILEAPEDITIYADYDRFVQIMVNIIQNAIQFTEKGTIRISLKNQGDETIIKVADTGIGMTAEQQKNIWDRYFKVDPSRKNTKYGESGLGLPIVQQLVKLHHGKIEVDSEKGVGTTFTIILPNKEPQK